MKKYVLFGLVVAFVVACATNPLTGRKSLALVKNSTIFPQAFAAYDQVLTQEKIDSTSEDAKMIKRVGERLEYAVNRFYKESNISNKLQGYEWEYTLIQKDQVNAWAMPGGKIAFYSGILPICQNETGVAVVMGHEINHALGGHSAEQMSNSMIAQGLMVAGNVGISNEQWRNTFNQFYPLGAQVTLLKYGRNMELDSDRAGLYLMAMAGYDPREAAPFWSRMAKQSEGQQRPPEFLSTHPDPGNRIAAIQKHLPKAMEYYNSSPYKDKNTGKK